MKKKIILLLLASMISVNLLSCGAKQENQKDNNVSTTDETSKSTEDTSKKDDTKEKETNTVTKSDSSSSNSKDTKQSSVSSPLQIGQTGIASKTTTEDSNDHDANISLTNIIRGDAAKEIVDKYNAEDNAVKISPLDSSQLEYAVAEYKTSLPSDFPTSEFGISPDFSTEIRGLDGEGLEYDGILYSVSTWDITGFETMVKTGASQTGRFVFQIPKGCSDYLISFGEYEGTKAYFKGK